MSLGFDHLLIVSILVLINGKGVYYKKYLLATNQLITLINRAFALPFFVVLICSIF